MIKIIKVALLFPVCRRMERLEFLDRRYLELSRRSQELDRSPQEVIPEERVPDTRTDAAKPDTDRRSVKSQDPDRRSLKSHSLCKTCYVSLALL